MKKLLLVALLACFAGCATAPTAPATHAASIAPAPRATSGVSDVQALTGYPAADYQNFGIVEVTYYDRAIRDPTITRALPKLKAQVRDMGGNAFIIRDKRMDGRSLSVSIEVLRVTLH